MKRAIRTIALCAAAVTLACAGQGAGGADPSAAPKKGIDRSKLPEPGPAEAWDAPDAEQWSLPNGMTVWYLPQYQAPLVSVRVVLPSGASTDPVDKPGLTSMVMDMLDEGAGEHSALDLNDNLQRLATDIYDQAATDSSVIGMNALADTLDASFALLADVVQRPRMEQADFERTKKIRVGRALSKEADPNTAVWVTLRRAMFGEGFAGFPNNGIRSGLEAIELEDVKKHYKAIVVPEGAAIVVVGAVERAAVSKAVEKYFGDWKGTRGVQPRPLRMHRAPREIHLVDYPGTTQSSIALVRRADGVETRELFAGEVFSWALAQSFTSRINMNLREDKAYTYGARGFFVRWPNVGLYTVQSSVRTDVTLASIQEVIKELEALNNGKPITAAEHADAVSGLKMGYPRKFEHMEQVASKLVDVPLYGRPTDWLTRWVRGVGGVTLEDANHVAQKVGRPEEFLIVVAGDRKVVEPELAKLGLPIVVRDAQGNVLSP